MDRVRICHRIARGTHARSGVQTLAGECIGTETPIFETYRLTFIAVQIPALVLLGYRINSSRSHLIPIALLTGFVFWMWLSTLWATSGRDTVVETTTLVLTAAVGLYLARSFSHVQQMILVCMAMQPGIIISYIAVKRNWEFAVSNEGHWVGIYFNRNSLAPVAAVGIVATLGVLWVVVHRLDKRWWPGLVFVLIDVALLNGYVLSRTRSSTSVGALLRSVGCRFWSVIRTFHRRFLTLIRLRYVYSSFVVVASIGMWGLSNFKRSCCDGSARKISSMGDRRFGTMDGLVFWSVRSSVGMDVSGKSSIFLKRDLWWTVAGAQFSHSSYIDVLLGGGIIGATLILLALIYGGYSQIESTLWSTAGQWTFAMTFFVLLASTQESFVVGNHFLWLLLVASMIGGKESRVERESVSVTLPQAETS